MILHMPHTLWTGISETNVNIITSATRTHALIIIIQLENSKRRATQLTSWFNSINQYLHSAGPNIKMAAQMVLDSSV